MTRDGLANVAAKVGGLLSFTIFLGALLVAAVFLNLSLRLAGSSGPPDGHWHATWVEGDTFWHLATGQRILDTHHWPTTNDYSFTAPHAEWFAYEWLGEVLMALTWKAGGLRALMVLLALLVSAMVLLVYYFATLTSVNPKCAFVSTALVLPLLGTCFSVRPQLLGYVFLLITLVCLERFRRGEQQNLWILPVVFMLWVNTHGSYAFGFAAMIAYALGGLWVLRPFDGKEWSPPQRQHLTLVFALCLGALLVNPYGPQLIRYELGITSQNVNLAYFQEWQPIPLREFFGLWFLGLTLVLIVGVWKRPRVHRVDLLALGLLAVVLACRHQRFVVLFGILAVSGLARMMAQVLPARDPDKNYPVLNGAAVVAVLIVMIARFPSTGRLQQAIDRTQPRLAMDYLGSHGISGPLFNDNFWGGYLIWASQRKQKVFIDGRSDAYEPSGVLSDYIDIFNLAPDTTALLEKYGVRACLVERSGSLSAWLQAQPAWQRVYEDGLATVFTMRSSLKP